MNPQAPTQNSAAPVAPETASTQVVNDSPSVYTNFLSRALPLAELGLEVFPIDARGKEPLALGFLNKRGKPARLATSTNATADIQTILIKWGGPEHAECNVGVFFRSTNYGVDIDSLSECERILGQPLNIQGARVNTSTPDKMHLYFDGALPDWFWTRGVAYETADGEKRELFSIRYDNRYLVGPGSIHPSGTVYGWAEGLPSSLPATNENLLRQLQEIAEKQGQAESKPEPMEKTLVPEKFDKLCDILRDNFERMDLPAYEERTARHGGINFIFEECVIEPHAEGDNTAQIGVRPDGVLTFSCFHGSHDLKWSEARPMIEARYGSKFDWQGFFGGPKPTIGGQTPKPETEPEPEPLKFTRPAVLRKQLDCIMAPTEGQQFNGWFPRGRPHGIGASSGQGKTTLIVDILDKQYRGETVFGHRGLKMPYLCIWADRGVLANEETLMRLGLDKADIPVEYMDGALFDRQATRKILALIERQPVMPAAVFIEGADFLTEDPYSTPKVATLMKDLQRIAAYYHLAMILSVGAPKMKPKEQYALMRDRIFGSQAWARTMDQVLILSQKHGAPPEDRTLTVLHRNAAEETFELTFAGGQGKLVQKVLKAGVKLNPVEMWVCGQLVPFTRGQAVQAMKDCDAGLQKSQVYDMLKRMVADGQLVETFGNGKTRLQLAAVAAAQPASVGW